MSDVTIPEDPALHAEIPLDVLNAAVDLCRQLALTPTPASVRPVARAILAERARWQPAATYFERYCQDEAEDVENCVCGAQQHEDAKAFAQAIRSSHE